MSFDESGQDGGAYAVTGEVNRHKNKTRILIKVTKE